MNDLVLQGERYTAIFRHTKKEDDSSTHVYSCWKTSPHMWWKGQVKITDNVTGRDARAFFETFHRSDVPMGIRSETLEESLLLIRGKNDKGHYVSHRSGGSIVINKRGVIDYLLEEMYEDALSSGQERIFPKINIPLLEQHNLAEHGYALEEFVSV